MPSRLIPYRYNTYTDALIAVGTAELIATLYGLRRADVHLRATPSGFEIEHPEGKERTEAIPFREIKYKEEQELKLPNPWDQTIISDDDDEPHWWSTTKAINRLTSTSTRPTFNNKLAQLYSSELGLQLLEGSADVNTGSMSALLYAQASKGVNKKNFSGVVTRQENTPADGEQMLALLGYQVGAAGFSAYEHKFSFSIVPRPKAITLRSYRHLVDGFLRGYFSRLSRYIYAVTDGKGGQVMPPFVAMAYFDFIIELFNYREDTPDMMGGVYDDIGVGNIIESLDRAAYRKMSRHTSAPFTTDSLAIPTWLEEKSVAVNVRNLIREMLSERPDPKLLYLPVRAFAENDPRLLVDFYRQYGPLRKPADGNRTSKTLLHQHTLHYVMDKTNYADLNCGEMQRFANAIRSRTYDKLYHDEQPDYNLLTKLKSASRNNDQLVNMLSEFVGSYNLHNARQSAMDKHPDGPNLRYDDLQVIIGLIEKYDAKFVADTLMAQAMSKREKEEEQTHQEPAAP